MTKIIQGSRSARLSPQSMTWDECKVYKNGIGAQQPPKVSPMPNAYEFGTFMETPIAQTIDIYDNDFMII